MYDNQRGAVDLKETKTNPGLFIELTLFCFVPIEAPAAAGVCFAAFHVKLQHICHDVVGHHLGE